MTNEKFDVDIWYYVDIVLMVIQIVFVSVKSFTLQFKTGVILLPTQTTHKC